jgi:hypothetical protein
LSHIVILEAGITGSSMGCRLASMYEQGPVVDPLHENLLAARAKNPTVDCDA